MKTLRQHADTFLTNTHAGIDFALVAAITLFALLGAALTPWLILAAVAVGVGFVLRGAEQDRLRNLAPVRATDRHH